MGWFGRNLHWILFAGFLATAVVGLGLGGVGLLLGWVAAVETAGFLVPLLETALPFVLSAILLVAVSLVLLLGSVVTAARRVSLPRPSLPGLSVPRSERLADRASRVEARFPALEALGVSAALEPTVEQRRERLKRRYVEGELTEREFERELSKLVDDPDGDGSPVDGPDPDAPVGDEVAADPDSSPDNEAVPDDSEAAGRERARSTEPE